MDKLNKAATVDEYLMPLPPDVYNALSDLRTAIKAAAPDAEEVISYQIPTYKHKGALVHFAAFKNHCGFYVVNKHILEVFKDELQPFKTSGTTIQFTPEQPVPNTLVKKIVELRVKQNEAL